MKDPAALLYIDKWLVSTKGMKASARGWYLNLILHQYDKGSLPNNIEDLADYADVKYSEFEEFKQVFEQVLKQKFVENEDGRLVNEFAMEIIRKRESFKEKRSESGKLSYVLKYIRKNHLQNKEFELFLKENINLDFDTKNEQLIEQVFKQIYELYRNKDKDKIINTNSSNYTNAENQKFSLPFQYSQIHEEIKNNSQTKEFCIRTYKIKEQDYNKFIDFFMGLNSDHSDNEIVDFKEWNKHFKEWMKFNYDKLPKDNQIQNNPVSDETKTKLSQIYSSQNALMFFERYMREYHKDELQALKDFERAKSQEIPFLTIQSRISNKELIYKN